MILNYSFSTYQFLIKVAVGKTPYKTKKFLYFQHIEYLLIFFTGIMIFFFDSEMPLTLNVPIPGKVKKVSEIFIFTLLCGASKGFIKAVKAFINF